MARTQLHFFGLAFEVAMHQMNQLNQMLVREGGLGRGNHGGGGGGGGGSGGAAVTGSVGLGGAAAAPPSRITTGLM